MEPRSSYMNQTSTPSAALRASTSNNCRHILPSETMKYSNPTQRFASSMASSIATKASSPNG